MGQIFVRILTGTTTTFRTLCMVALQRYGYRHPSKATLAALFWVHKSLNCILQGIFEVFLDGTLHEISVKSRSKLGGFHVLNNVVCETALGGLIWVSMGAP